MRIAGYLIILAAILCRCLFLMAEPRSPHDLSGSRDVVAAALTANDAYAVDQNGHLGFDALNANVAEVGVSTIMVERFDPSAAVVMLPGADEQPGVAGVDDNGDAVVDNPSELGATRSDDVCVVASADEEDQLPQPKLVLQRGAFVPSDQTGEGPVRFVVYGATGKDRWSFLVERD